jgi:hypothetical protein
MHSPAAEAAAAMAVVVEDILVAVAGHISAAVLAEPILVAAVEDCTSAALAWGEAALEQSISEAPAWLQGGLAWQARM